MYSAHNRCASLQGRHQIASPAGLLYKVVTRTMNWAERMAPILVDNMCILLLLLCNMCRSSTGCCGHIPNIFDTSSIRCWWLLLISMTSPWALLCEMVLCAYMKCTVCNYAPSSPSLLAKEYSVHIVCLLSVARCASNACHQYHPQYIIIVSGSGWSSSGCGK